ncbi:MAG: hypothetical protein Q4G16_13005, partial [Cruoricaptor ignavus]|nr:hypothetical protein [Cruoricaptor ignavus]
NRVAKMINPEVSTLVYVNNITYTGTATKVAKIDAEGFYFWDGADWEKITPPPLANSTTNIIYNNTVERAALTGDVTAPQNGNTTTIANNAVTSSKIANGTILPEDLSIARTMSGEVLFYDGQKWVLGEQVYFANNIGMRTAIQNGRTLIYPEGRLFRNTACPSGIAYRGVFYPLLSGENGNVRTEMQNARYTNQYICINTLPNGNWFTNSGVQQYDFGDGIENSTSRVLFTIRKEDNPNVITNYDTIMGNDFLGEQDIYWINNAWLRNVPNFTSGALRTTAN